MKLSDAINNWQQMPYILKLISLLGLISPFLPYSGEIIQSSSDEYLLLAIKAGTLPVLVASLLIFFKINMGRWLYSFGWITVSIPTLALSYLHKSETFLHQVLFDSFILIFFLGYFLCSKEVHEFFSNHKIE